MANASFELGHVILTIMQVPDLLASTNP